MTATPPVVHIMSAWRAGSSDGRPGWRFTFTPTPEAVDAVKAGIASRYREYFPDTHVWWSDVSQERALLAVAPSFEAFRAQAVMGLWECDAPELRKVVRDVDL